MSQLDRKGMPPALLAKVEALLGDRRTPGDAAIRWSDMDRLAEHMKAARLVARGVASANTVTPVLPAGATTWSPRIGPITTTTIPVPEMLTMDMAGNISSYAVSIQPRDLAPTYSGAPTGDEWIGWAATLMPTILRADDTPAVRILLQLYGRGNITLVPAHSVPWAIHRLV